MKSKIFLQEKQFDQQIGEILKYYRKYKNLTQVELSKLIGISAQQLQKYEIGKNKISASRLKKISEILEVPANHFFESSFSNLNVMRHKFTESDSKTDIKQLINCYSRIKSEKVRNILIQNAMIFMELGL